MIKPAVCALAILALALSVHPGATAQTASAIPNAAPPELPFRFEQTPGRLPKTVVPSDYAISLVPDLERHRFAGSETVHVRVRVPVREIVVNTNAVTVTRARVDGVPAKVTTDVKAQTTTLSLGREHPAGTASVELAFTGTMGRAPQGLFYQPYDTPAGRKELISTEFESTDARRMFPCWDEPAFRASYRLSVTLPAALTAVSNMPVASRSNTGSGLVTTTFAPTPKMASYLVELTAGDLGFISGTSAGTAIRVVAPRGREEAGRYALASAEKLLAYYDDYFGVRYPLPKLDLIAIPGGFGGAMENWGAITFRDTRLLDDPRSTSLDDRQKIFSIIAHEMAHQWFGDLVTMAWWNDIWLNESFASWMAAKATDHFNPDWRWREEQIASDKERALVADARVTTHPLQQHVTNEMEADAAFDPAITYSKGQAVLEMFESAVGADAFRNGLRAYMRDHAYSNATTADLWAALGTATQVPIASIAPTWTRQAGYPLVSASATCTNGTRTVTLAQSRFIADGRTAPGLWQIPVALETGNGRVTNVQLTTPSATFPAGACSDPLVVNAGGEGFYRVDYDAAQTEGLRSRFARIGHESQLTILSDEWALAQAGRRDVGSYLGFVQALGTEADEAVWTQVIAALGTIERYERGRPAQTRFEAFARRVLGTVANPLGSEPVANEAPTLGDLRDRLFAALGFYGDPGTVARARRLYAGFVANPASLRPGLQDPVLQTVARWADAPTWNAMRAAAKRIPDVALKVRYYTALAGVRSDALAQEALAMTTSGELPPESPGLAPRLVMEVARAGHSVAVWRFLNAHFDEVARSETTFARTSSVFTFATVLWDAVPPATVETFERSHVVPEAAVRIPRSMDAIRTELAERNRIEPELTAYLQRTAGGS